MFSRLNLCYSLKIHIWKLSASYLLLATTIFLLLRTCFYNNISLCHVGLLVILSNLAVVAFRGDSGMVAAPNRRTIATAAAGLKHYFSLIHGWVQIWQVISSSEDFLPGGDQLSKVKAARNISPTQVIATTIIRRLMLLLHKMPMIKAQLLYTSLCAIQLEHARMSRVVPAVRVGRPSATPINFSLLLKWVLLSSLLLCLQFTSLMTAAVKIGLGISCFIGVRLQEVVPESPEVHETALVLYVSRSSGVAVVEHSSSSSGYRRWWALIIIHLHFNIIFIK